MRGKEIKLDISDKYNVSLGTVDTKENKSLYFTVSSWYEPKTDDDVDYKKIISYMHKDIKLYLTEKINKDMFTDKLIVCDLDMRESGIKYGKKSYMCCEVTLYGKNNLEDIESDIVKDGIRGVVSGIISDKLDPNKYFDFQRTKK